MCSDHLPSIYLTISLSLSLSFSLSLSLSFSLFSLSSLSPSFSLCSLLLPVFCLLFSPSVLKSHFAQVLKLGSNHIQDTGLEALSQSLAELTRLEVLDLSKNKMCVPMASCAL